LPHNLLFHVVASETGFLGLLRDNTPTEYVPKEPSINGVRSVGPCPGLFETLAKSTR